MHHNPPNAVPNHSAISSIVIGSAGHFSRMRIRLTHWAYTKNATAPAIIDRHSAAAYNLP